MIDGGTIKNLANLARIELTDAESVKIQNELGSILDYISELKNAPVGDIVNDDEHINIFRDDENAHEPGIFTGAILENVPKQKDGYFAVKQIIEEKKNK